MTSWLTKLAPKLLSTDAKKNIPAGVWIKCPECGETLYSKDLDKNLKVCLLCNYHFRLTAEERIEQLFDENSFVEMDRGLLPIDPLKFVDSKKYKDRIKQTMAKTKLNESITSGVGKIKEREVAAAIFNFRYMGGSMGSVAGEKITRVIELALKRRIPLIIVSASGGARMQEGAFSLMQMAKTSAALSRLAQEGIPYISLMTDPTTGGVSASFAMLGDINMAEPGALIGFAGARVIQQTIKQNLPQGFQRSEFLKEHGQLDLILERKDLRDKLTELFGMLLPT